MSERLVRCLSVPGAFMLRRSKRTQLIGAFAAGTLLSGTLLTFAVNGSTVDAAAPRQPARSAASVPIIVATQSKIDLLRNEAASGDEFSNRALTAALMDKFDSTGDSNDLYEAMVWVDRRRDAFGNSELSERVFAQYCEHRVVRWHWFCVLGE